MNKKKPKSSITINRDGCGWTDTNPVRDAVPPDNEAAVEIRFVGGYESASGIPSLEGQVANLLLSKAPSVIQHGDVADGYAYVLDKHADGGPVYRWEPLT